MEKLFEKQLSQTDVEVRLSVPMDSLDGFGIPKDGYSFNFHATDINERSWRFRLIKRRKDKHPKPVLSAGWPEYSRTKGLKKEDKLILIAEEVKAATKKRFRILAQRKKAIMLLGKKIEGWVNVEYCTGSTTSIANACSTELML